MTPLLLLWLTFAAPDTLSASMVSSGWDLPVMRAAESERLGEARAVPTGVADVLRRFTGVQVKDYGGTGGLKTVNVRSLGSEHIGVFIDGIQVDNAQNMQVDLGRFSTDGLSEVSLYNAQKSVRLQTAKEYAAGASVYLSSTAPLGDRLAVRLRGGSFGTVNPSLEWTRLMGKVSFRASADFLTSNGRYKFPFFDTTLVRENSDISALRFETQLYGREWQLRLYSYGSERGFPGPVIRRASGFPFSAERQADQNMFVQGSWTHDWTERYATSVRFKYGGDYTHYNTHAEKNPMAVTYDVRYRQQSAYLSLAQSFMIMPIWSVDLSTDLQGNTLDSPAAPRRLTFTGALATRLLLPKLRFAAHLAWQGAWDWFASQQPSGWTLEDARRHSWMPSVSASWTPLAWLEASAFIRRTFRMPSFNDLYYTLIGNSALSPESASQIGLDLWLQGGQPLDSSQPIAWSIRISPYYNKVQDKIVAIPTSSQFRWTMLNIGIVDITGLDVKASLDWSAAPWSAGAVARYCFQQSLDHTTPGSQTYGNQIPYIPLHSGSVDILLSWRTLSLTWSTTLTGERWSRSANTSDYHIAPWSTTDLAICYRLSNWHNTNERQRNRLSDHLSISLRCSNIFDHPYQIVQGYPMPGRNLLAGVELRF